MKKLFRTLCAASCVAIIATGCGFPLEEGSTVDTRPALTFKNPSNAEHLQFAIDGVSYGPVDNYLEGKAAIRVLPGTHTVTIIHPNGTTSTQKVFVSDGVRKTLIAQ